MFDNPLPISFYKEIAILNEDHKVYIVQHIETKKIYVKKCLSIYNREVYVQLYKYPVEHIPRIYAIYENDDTLTIIEEYISGETLQDILDIGVEFSEKEVIDYAVKLCNILSSLHNQNPAIIHRDIKPSNIVLTEDNSIILLDLNAARLWRDEKDRDTRLLGTEGYAAPEQFGFGNSSRQTDIYAIGNLIKTLLRVESSPDSHISAKLGKVIEKCLEMNPKDRYQSANQLSKNLRKCL